MVKTFLAVWSKFDRPVFYLFGPLDSAYWTSPKFTFDHDFTQLRQFNKIWLFILFCAYVLLFPKLCTLA